MSNSRRRMGQTLGRSDHPSIGNNSPEQTHADKNVLSEADLESYGQSLERRDHQIERLQKQLLEAGEIQQILAVKLDERNREIAALIVMLEARDAAVARLLKQEQQTVRDPALPASDASEGRSSTLDFAAGDEQQRSSALQDDAKIDAVAAYEQTIIELSKEVDSLQAEVSAVRNELLMARKQTVQFEREKNKAKEELQARFAETASLTAQLERASQEIARFQQVDFRATRDVPTQPVATKSSRKLFPSWVVWGSNKGEGRKSKKALMEEIALVRSSRSFDATWYLETYRDVAQSGMDPAVHYIKYGANEGRDPGPMFSTTVYTREHPEVVNQKINPLVHYIRSVGTKSFP